MHWSTGIVLIVDPEDEVLEILRTALQFTDYVLMQAKTGDEALAVLSRLKSHIDLTIIDLDVPNDDGLVVSLLTILEHRKNTKIIVKTSRQDKPFLEQVNYFGIDAIVLKPTSADQLVGTVNAVLSRIPHGSVRPSKTAA
jgi:DNA-binding response OmpR family regulator